MLALLQQAQGVADEIARVGIAAGRDRGVDEALKVLGQGNAALGHERIMAFCAIPTAVAPRASAGTR